VGAVAHRVAVRRADGRGLRGALSVHGQQTLPILVVRGAAKRRIMERHGRPLAGGHVVGRPCAP
jgi:hypothetical protein